ncbi:PAS domain S-box protein [Hymenobacter sp. HMF4947]|uniref:histidine kinase n=1 Tax=Hymenobacter ginkgonis TaxID=2682976 RepID=A0A7K1TF03_9BACT|nr:PAS domain S-box protein [Hymenobacter ginkgonis]MVN76990.1 PAS domain S-box protein [Hymenobacter ginkgonis]
MAKAITYFTDTPAEGLSLDLPSLLQTMPWAVLLLDAAGIVRLANAAVAAVWGLAPAVLQGSQLGELLPAATYPALHALLAAPAPAHGECYLPHCAQWLALSTAQLPQGLALYGHDITALRRTEAEAHEQAHLLASISNATPDLIYITDLQTHSVSYASGHVQALLGYSPAQLYAQGPAAFGHILHPDDQALRLAHLQACVLLPDEQLLTQDVRLRLGDGRYHWFRLRDRAFRRGADGRVSHSIGIAQDVQAEREATDRLHQHHELLLGVFASAQVGLSYQQAVRDEQGQLLDFRLQTLNSASLVADHQSGLGQGELLSEALPHLRQHELWGKFTEALATGQPMRLETHYQHAQLSAWLDVSITPLGDGLILSSLDISARKQAELELQHKNSILEAVYGAALTGIQVLQSVRDAAGELVDFEWVYATRAAEALLGQGPLVGRQQAATLAPTPPLATWAQQQQVVATGQPAEHEMPYPLPSSCTWLRVLLVPFGDGLVLAHEDITARKTEEATMRASRQQLQQTLDALPQIVWTRLPNGQLGTFNARWYAYTGLSVAQSQADGWQAALHPDDLPRLLAGRSKANLDGTSRTVEVRVQRHDGRYRWHLCQVVPLYHEAGELLYWVGSATDIDDRKQTETELQENKHLLEAVFHTSPQAFALTKSVRNATGDIVDFSFLWTNEKCRALLHGHDLTGLRLLADVAPRFLTTGIFDKLVASLHTGQLVEEEAPYAAAGPAQWLRWTAARLGDGNFLTLEDITARKLADLERRHGQELLQAVFDSTTDGIEVFKSVRNAQGELIDFEWVLHNQVSQRLLGRTDLVGKRWLAELPGMAELGVFGRHRRVADHGEVAELEWHYQGEELRGWFHSVAVQLGDGLLVTWQDITARKRQQAETLRLQLTQQQQLAQAVLEAEENEKRRIAESLHNGLGQLLYATKLSLAQLDPAQPIAFAATLHKTSELLSTAIGQTRTLSHELMPQILADFGLEVAIQDICTTCSMGVLRMRSRVDDVPPRLSPHLALALYRMAQELANNIVKHSQATRASLQLLGQADGTIELRADDNGVGFVPNLPQVGRPGIGLQALHDRVRLLRGTLHLLPTPAQGTQVIIRLPWAVPTAAATSTTPVYLTSS